MLKFVLAGISICAAFAVFADDAAISETEIWNEGVEFYRAGDATNALERLRPLLLSRKYGARAAEIVGALAYEKATSPVTAEQGGDTLAALEEAAAAAQIALRAAPDDERARRNFTRAVKELPELRKTRHLNSVLATAQGKSADGILLAARDASRAIMSDATTYRTNSAAVAIALGDALEQRAKKLADDWLAVREGIAQAVTNEEQAATIVEQLDQCRERTLAAAKALGDLQDGAYGLAAQSEDDFNRYFKLVALPRAAIEEDLVCQSNAWQDVENFNNRSWQQEALDLTRMFRIKFPAWAQQYEQAAQADTNKPPFTAEAQAKISALSTELEKLQIDCVKNELPPQQEAAVGLIREIIELMPKDQSSQNGQSSDNSQQKQNDNSDKDKNKNDEDPSQQNGEPQEQQAEAQQEEERQAEEKESGNEQSEDDKEIEAILKKAQERADEHEADKKARMRRIPLAPNERDW